MDFLQLEYNFSSLSHLSRRKLFSIMLLSSIVERFFLQWCLLIQYNSVKQARRYGTEILRNLLSFGLPGFISTLILM